jgi:hypothetical protein
MTEEPSQDEATAGSGEERDGEASGRPGVGEAATPGGTGRPEALSSLEAEGGPTLSSTERGRLDELMGKRRDTGLTDPEAEELGRLIAASAGRQHSSARSLREGENSGE